jgi:hypothetical protein
VEQNAQSRFSFTQFAVAFACLQVAVTALYFALARVMPALESPLLAGFVLLQFAGAEVILFTKASRLAQVEAVQWLTAVLKGLVLAVIAFAVIALLSAVILREIVAVPLDELATASAPVWLAALLTAPCFGVYYATRGPLLSTSGWDVMFAAGLFYGAVLMAESFVYEGLLRQAGWSACKPSDCSAASFAVYLPLVAVLGAIESLPFAWAYRKLESRS